jgi:tripartite-type tricarboxylate transporter receptor subunit TctC
MKSQHKTRVKRSVAVLAAPFASLVLAAYGHASESIYPTKTVRIVVPYTPGGGIDLIGRTVAQELAQPLGQQVIVENRPGASTIIGADVVAKAPPDGHTLLVTSHSTHAFLPNLKKKLPYDADKDFEPVALLVSQSFVLVVHPSMPVRDVKQLLAFARARPGELTYSSSGLGTGTHFSGELLKTLGKIDIRHIPYKGGAQSFTELAGGHVAMSFGSIASSLPYVKAGKVRMIGSTGIKRSPGAPDLPTIAETIPGYEMTAWSALFAPGGTPKAVVERLSAEVAKAFGRPAVKNRLAALGYEIETSSPEELKAYISKERAMYGKLIKMVGLER